MAIEGWIFVADGPFGIERDWEHAVCGQITTTKVRLGAPEYCAYCGMNSRPQGPAGEDDENDDDSRGIW